MMLRPGDHVRVARCGGLYWHHALVTATNKCVHFLKKPNEQPVVAETSWLEFVGGECAVVELVAAAPDGQREQIVTRARRRVGERGYNLFGMNCESLAREIQTGQAHSEQADAAIVLGGIAILGALLFASQPQRPSA